MKWEETALEVLKSKFNNGIFRAKDVFKLLNEKEGYSRGTVYRVLHDLYKRGLIERLGRGIYKVLKTVELKETSVSPSVSVKLVHACMRYRRLQQLLRKLSQICSTILAEPVTLRYNPATFWA
jgi:predicted transcriptional regulator